MGKLFGTDGARGGAGKDRTPELAMQIGCAAAAVLAGKTQHRPRFIIGKEMCIRDRCFLPSIRCCGKQ